MSRLKPDPARVRHAVLLASAIGLDAAGERVGISSNRLCEWRKELEAQTGERFPRLKPGAYQRTKKLSDAKRAELRARRRRGVSWGVLARIYGVSQTTCRRIWAEVPEQVRSAA